MPNEHSDEKNHTYGHSTFFIENAERHGPLRTYLVTASERPHFKLLTNTIARRLVRTGGHVTGVELECNKGGSVGPGQSGVVNVTPGTGRVIVSAGTFGSAKLLFRSGIGPTDQLTVVKNSATDGATMISSDQWINLPVGNNLNDHVGVSAHVLSYPVQDCLYFCRPISKSPTPTSSSTTSMAPGTTQLQVIPKHISVSPTIRLVRLR